MSKKKPPTFRLSIRHHPKTDTPLSTVTLHQIDGGAKECVMYGQVWPDVATQIQAWATALGVPIDVEESPWEGEMNEMKTGDLFAEIPEEPK